MSTLAPATPTRALIDRWRAAQRASDDLLARIRPAALAARPIPERHRLVFYLGHLEAFDWNLLAAALELKPFHPAWDHLFAFGIDPVAGELPSDQPGDWPDAKAIREYNRQVRQRLSGALEAAGAIPPSKLVEVAIEHRWMHVETLAYLLHNLSYDQKMAGPAAAWPALPPAEPEFLPVGAGVATLGQARGNGFGWDNEFDPVAVAVPAFQAARYKTTNRQWLAFVEQGGPVPHFWRRGEGGGWNFRGMFAETALPLDAPVYVSHAQAQAYCDWAGAALPTEAQWHRMAYGAPDGGERAFPWGDAPPTPDRGNFDLRAWDPAPVHAHPAGRSAWGIDDLLGNGWEWTSSLFAPFPGFEPFSFYPGYSANFFDGQHYVLKGASPRTAACLLRRSFRNWFQPHYPYLYAAFRCVTA